MVALPPLLDSDDGVDVYHAVVVCEIPWTEPAAAKPNCGRLGEDNDNLTPACCAKLLMAVMAIVLPGVC